eukprot:3862755-Alexandrium_andersonii.AAC.1
MPPQDGRAGGLPTRGCQYTDVRKKQAPSWENWQGWMYWQGKWRSPPEIQAYNSAYWRGHSAGYTH